MNKFDIICNKCKTVFNPFGFIGQTMIVTDKDEYVDAIEIRCPHCGEKEQY